MAPVANDDIVRSNWGGTAFFVPEWAFLANDTDANGDPLDVDSVNDESGLSADHTTGTASDGTV